ncbi:MAG: homocysteine S-methyltransferase family protein [Ruminococcus sp.]|nr:homocysteine S-methyltransferase family protein [Ruminococcus sp.]
MDIRSYLKENIVLLDGGMGTLLQEQGLKAGERPERWNISHPDVVTAIHKAYFDAGSNVVNTNTFGANPLHFDNDELREIVYAAVANAKTAREQSNTVHEKYVALDIGPTGRLLKPMGDLDFEDAVACFAQTVRIGVQCGVDLIMIETMNDSYETKAALLAAKENCNLPIFVSNAYSENGKLMTGASPAAMVALLEGMGADAIGVNCSFGPDKLTPIVRDYLKYASVPVLLKPNAGLPQSIDGKTVYNIMPDQFADITSSLVKEGVRVAGGCCGTTPEYIKALNDRIDSVTPFSEKKNFTVVSSYSHGVFFTGDPVLIGERINPTGKKRLKAALKENDIAYLLNEGIRQQSCGAHILDVNVGLPEIDEPEMLEKTVCELQTVVDLPLQIDTSDPVAMERALRRYNGKALINSVNGKEESMKAIFPLMKKYGGVAVALTLDENGIPDSAEGRVEIAKKIIRTAEEYGIDKKDLIFDTLAMAVSADSNAARATIDSLSVIRNELGVHTSLGVSNISFGLPKRDIVTASFFTSALERGLSAAIMNPFSTEMMKAYHSYRVLHGYDDNCTGYISFAESLEGEEVKIKSKDDQSAQSSDNTLKDAIVKGLKEQSSKLTIQLMGNKEPLDIVKEDIIPALDIVGVSYEQGKVYLPQLLMSAEAAKSAFEEIKKVLSDKEENTDKKCPFVIATVKGDIHDIGKNIVKLLLENYGYEVYDLGKDVPPEAIVDKVLETRAPLVGLSALMTTTVPAMEETIKLLREKAPFAKVDVGGAVLTQEYADAIGADRYSKDAMDSVRYAEEVYNNL